jgi:hypothetical protein
LRSAAMSGAVPMSANVAPPPVYPTPPAATIVPNGYDPYAGAAVMRPGG